MRIAWRATVLSVADARGDVAEAVGDEAYAETRWRLADGADAVLLVHQDLPDLLRVLVAAFDLEARRFRVELEDLQDVRIVRLHAFAAAGRIPLRILRREGGAWNHRHCPGG